MESLNSMLEMYQVENLAACNHRSDFSSKYFNLSTQRLENVTLEVLNMRKNQIMISTYMLIKIKDFITENFEEEYSLKQMDHLREHTKRMIIDLHEDLIEIWMCENRLNNQL